MELDCASRVTFTGPIPPADVAARLREADVLILPNRKSAISTEFTSPLKLFEYMASGRPDRRERPAVVSRGPARRGERAAGRSGQPAGAGRGHHAHHGRPGARRTARAPGARRRARVHLGAAGGTARNAVSRGDGSGAVISPRLLALVRCPACHGALTGDSRRARLRRLRTAVRRTVAGLPRPAAARKLRGAHEVPRRSAARRRAPRARLAAAARIEDPQRHAARVPRAGAGRSWWSISAAAAGAALLWNRDWQRARRRHRHRAVLRTASRAARWICCSAICGGCRSRTARSPRPTRSTCSSTSRPRRCAACCGKPRGSSRRAVSCSSTPTSARTRAIAIGLRWINALAGRLDRAGLIDLRQERLRKSDHLNPLADIPELRRVAAGRRLSRQADPLLHADRRRLRREYPDADGGTASRRSAPRGATGTSAMTQEDALKAARTAGKRARRLERRHARGAARADRRDEARPAAVRPHRVGPVLRAAGTTRPVSRRDGGRAAVKILYSAIDQTVPGTKGGSVHVAAVAEGLAALGHEVIALVTQPGAGHAAGPSGPVRTGSSDARRRFALDPPAPGPRRRGRARSRATSSPTRHRAVPQLRRRGDPAWRRRWTRSAVLEVNAPVIDYPGSAKALLDRALLVQPMRRWRERLCRIADVIVTPNAGDPSVDRAARADRGARVGRRHRPLPARRWSAETPFVRPAGHDGRDLRRRVPVVARRDSPRRGDPDAARARTQRHRRRVRRRRAGAARACAQPRAGSTRSFSPARCPHERMPACSPARGHRRRAVRRRRARAAVAGVLLVAAEDLRIHGGGPSGRRARGRSDSRRSSPTGAKGCSTTLRDRGGAQPRGGARRDAPAIERSGGPRRARRGGARARRARLQLGGALPRARVTRIIESAGSAGRADEDPHSRPTPFRPSAAAAAGARTSWRVACGRAGTTSRSSSRGPASRPASRDRNTTASASGSSAPPRPTVPFVRNYFKNEKLTRSLSALSRHRSSGRNASTSCTRSTS